MEKKNIQDGTQRPEAGREDRAALVASLYCQLTSHLKEINDNGDPARSSSYKEQVRKRHAFQRADVLQRTRKALRNHAVALLSKFAVGNEIIPENIDPEIVLVKPGTKDALLFRLATSLWSVPVSAGYGRRMRFLVMDRSNQKLIGIFALGDPVFNLRVRDDWIGWSVEQRKTNLVNVMDGYVVGAVPPYTDLLGGKLVTSLIASAEVSRAFRRRYSKAEGVISGLKKDPRLALVTITSALGRSSMYNRLKLPGMVELHKIGVTDGWGHFHVPDEIFSQMRQLLTMDHHKYADGHQFGEGPNWRMRVIRRALSLIGLDEALLRHGINREVYVMPLAKDWQKFLRGERGKITLRRPKAREIANASIDRWIMPRATRRPEFEAWSANDIQKMFEPILSAD